MIRIFLLVLLCSSLNSFASHIKVLFWPNQNMGFGHVAIEMFLEDDQQIPTYYMSYAMGNDFSVDMQKHGMAPERIILPKQNKEMFQAFEFWYAASEYAQVNSANYGKSYSLFNHNCAHAVLNVLRKFGYDVKLRNSFALTPRSVRKEALRISRGSGG